MADSRGSEPDESYFSSIPFCAAILADSRNIITPTVSRQTKSSTEDSFWAETMNTPSTIAACLTVYEKPEPPSSKQTKKVRMLLSVGSGVNGHPRRLHGGVIASIFDEAMGTLMTVNRDLAIAAGAGKGSPGGGIEGGGDVGMITTSTSTAYLRTSFLKLIPTPQVLVASAWLQEVKGRKVFVEADIRNGEDVVLAKCDALWIMHKSGEKL